MSVGSNGRGWWHRNAIPLIALAVLAPLAAGTIAWQEFHTYFDGRHWQPITVPVGETIELGGAAIGPATLLEVPADAAVEVPAGGRTLAVQLTVIPGDEPVSCMRPRLRERSTGREWEGDDGGLGWRGEASCFEATGPVFINVPFVVPVDSGPFEVEIEILDDRPLLPRFLVEGP